MKWSSDALAGGMGLAAEALGFFAEGGDFGVAAEEGFAGGPGEGWGGAARVADDGAGGGLVAQVAHWRLRVSPLWTPIFRSAAVAGPVNGGSVAS
ncbi:MAG: hypothetical protein U0793_00440 [Gemmataceae bacterium]